MLHVLLWLVFLAFLTSCQSSNYEDFREKGRSKTRSLIAELKKNRTKDQLIEHEEDILRAFSEITSLMKAVQEFHESHPGLEPPPLTAEDRELSDQLRMELLRIYRLEGGKEIVDRCRENSLIFN